MRSLTSHEPCVSSLRDERRPGLVREPQDLRINVEQNGALVMQAHTADMINGLRDLIRFLSSVTTLKPGTLITTGTPAGVSKLADGDHLKGTIEGIGTMELNVRAEA